MRERLPETREGWTHRGTIYGAPEVCPGCGAVLRDGKTKVFITCNYFPGGLQNAVPPTPQAATEGAGLRPAEVFVTCDESGCCLDGFADVFATALSMLWQYGASLEETYRKFAHQEFEPKGRTDNPEARLARSLVDYVMQVVKGETEKRSLGPKRPVIWEEVIGSGR